MLHEGLVLLFRNRPTLAPELLQNALGVKLPAYTEARVETAEMKALIPTEYRADVVVVLLAPKPVESIVVEVQLQRDQRKRLSWPLYLAYVQCRESCPSELLVVAPRPEVARWCARPIRVGHEALNPPVLSRHLTPVITDKRQARRCPELAVLSAIMHGRQAVGPAVVRAALYGVKHLRPARCCLYTELIVSSLGDAARAALEKQMNSGNYQFQSSFGRKYFGLGQKAGRQEGLEKGLAKGLEKGRQEGLREGHQKGEAMALLEVLDARGLPVSASARRRILACTSQVQLKSWLRRAVTVTSVNELFGPRPTSRHAAR